MIRLSLDLPRDSSFVPVMRQLTVLLLESLEVSPEVSSDIQVAVTEACANVVRHAAGTVAYSVSLAVGPEGCEVEVSDRGPGFAPSAAHDCENADAEAGRGLLLISALVDDLEFLREHDVTRVRLVKNFTCAPAALPGGR